MDTLRDPLRYAITHLGSACFLSAGDYEGRIYIWHLFTGERKAWLCHRAERFETSVECLQWLPAFSPEQRQQQEEFAEQLAAEAAAMTMTLEAVAAGAAAVAQGKSTGYVGPGASATAARQNDLGMEEGVKGSGSSAMGSGRSSRLGVDGESKQGRSIEKESMTGAELDAGDSWDGELKLPGVSFGRASFAPTAAAESMAGRTVTIAAAAAEGGAGPAASTSGFGGPSAPPPSSAGALVQVHPHEAEGLLLLSCGGDGLVRVWKICPLGTGALLCMLPGRGEPGYRKLVVAHRPFST